MTTDRKDRLIEAVRLQYGVRIRLWRFSSRAFTMMQLIMLSIRDYEDLSCDALKMVLLHETGHCLQPMYWLQKQAERDAEKFAFREMSKAGYKFDRLIELVAEFYIWNKFQCSPQYFQEVIRR